jgi:hypothetical protein
MKKLHEGTAMESLEFKGRWETINIESRDADGDVEIRIIGSSVGSLYFFINQDQIKMVIEHLQKQLI